MFLSEQNGWIEGGAIEHRGLSGAGSLSLRYGTGDGAYPPSPEVFRHVSEKGEQLRRLHLMEAAALGDTAHPYHGEGSDVVASGYPKWEAGKGNASGGSGRTGRVYINDEQYFADVPKVAWTFHIGGYQPAQKWLKDRRSRALTWNDIGHYQRIIKILSETDRIMTEIDLPFGEEVADEA